MGICYLLSCDLLVLGVCDSPVVWDNGATGKRYQQRPAVGSVQSKALVPAANAPLRLEYLSTCSFKCGLGC